MSDVSLLSLSDEKEQYQSLKLSLTSDYHLKDVCRICQSEERADSPLISPCQCSGPLCYVHNSCLQELIKSSGTNCCEICNFQFVMETKLLPFWKWKRLNVTYEEKLMVLFFILHSLIIPSLAFLILMAKKIDDEQEPFYYMDSLYKWPLRIIAGIGLLIEIVFMVCLFIIFVRIFLKWRRINRIIYVQNAPKIGETVQQQQQHAMSDVSCSSLLPPSNDNDYHHSPQSSVSIDDNLKDVCRICQSEGQDDSPLIFPCQCSGPRCYVHNSCLQEWIKSSNTNCCDICHFQFIMETKFLPFWKWKQLKMAFVEKLTTLFFIFYALMVPSLACLILLAEKMGRGESVFLNTEIKLSWTLKILIAIGLYIEIVFMVFLCIKIVQLFLNWKSVNRIIYEQNARKIGETVQYQQQHAVEFSEFSRTPTNDLSSNNTNFIPLKESNNCQCDSEILNSNPDCVEFCDEKNTPGETTKTKTNSNGNLPISDYYPPLKEVVVVSSAADDTPKTTADNIQTAENDSQKASLVAATDNVVVSVANLCCPMNEFLETSPVH